MRLPESALPILLVALLAACGGGPYEVPPVLPPGVVHGTVRDTDGNPLAGAEVAIADGSTTTTGPGGHYSIDALPLGTGIRVTARMTGHYTVSSFVDLTHALPSATVDFTLRDLPASAPPDDDETPSLAVFAYVLNSTFDPGDTIRWAVDVRNDGPAVDGAFVEDSMDEGFGPLEPEAVQVDRAIFPDASVRVLETGVLRVDLGRLPHTDGLVRAYTFSVTTPLVDDGVHCHRARLTVPLTDTNAIIDEGIDCFASTAGG